MIMGWKHVDTLQVRPPSINDSVGNVVKFRSNQLEIKSNMETGLERIQSKVKTKGDRKGYNMDTKENGTKKCLYSVETKEIVKSMHKSYAEKVR